MELCGYIVNIANEQVRKRPLFLSHLYLKMMILPRQARDKHREITPKKSTTVLLQIPTLYLGAESRLRLLPSFFSTSSSFWIFGGHFVQKDPNVCQDRLGTDIGHVENRTSFLQAAALARMRSRRKQVRKRLLSTEGKRHFF